MKTLTWILAATLAAAGCYGSMMSDPDRMRSMVDDARRENDAHRVATDTASSLAHMREEMGRHQAEMGDMMGGMGTAMDGMSHCTGAGMQELRDMHVGMLDEMGQHGAAMDQTTTLDGATTEVLRHTGAMDDMLAGMDEASDSMGCM